MNSPPREGLQQMLVGCDNCGWHMQIEVDVRIVSETDEHWNCTSRMTEESIVILCVAAGSHLGPMRWAALNDDAPDFNARALGLPQ